MATPPKRKWSWRSGAGRALVYQALLVVVLLGLLAYLASNTVRNMQARGIQSGFGFLADAAGFDISESLISFESIDPYWKAFLVGLLNTLRVAAIGIVLTTVLGTLLGVGRFASNALVRGACYAYVELFRNVPVLLQLLMWYLLLVEYLPAPQEPIHLLGDWVFLSKGGLAFPVPQWSPHWAWSVPVPSGFLMEGGATVTPEFLAVLLGLSLYTAAFVAEVVRSGIASVSRGQADAAASLGLSPAQTMRLVTLPQALRVIVPPLTNQYLNLTKNSSLAVAIGYPDVVSIANTALNQTGRAVECIAIIMLVYLSTSLSTSALMNAYNRRVAIAER